MLTNSIQDEEQPTNDLDYSPDLDETIKCLLAIEQGYVPLTAKAPTTLQSKRLMKTTK